MLSYEGIALSHFPVIFHLILHNFRQTRHHLLHLKNSVLIGFVPEFLSLDVEPVFLEITDVQTDLLGLLVHFLDIELGIFEIYLYKLVVEVYSWLDHFLHGGGNGIARDGWGVGDDSACNFFHFLIR